MTERMSLVRRFALLILAAGGAVSPFAPLCAQNPEDVRARERYYVEQRAYPSDSLAISGLTEVLRWRTSALSRTASVAPGANILTSAQWSPLGPFGVFPADGYYSTTGQADAGRVVDVAFDPTNRDVFFVGSAGGGVWRTTAAGAVWAPVTDNQCSLNTGAIAVDPKAHNIVYAATGELNAGSVGCGILRSLDGGASWQRFGAPQFGPESGRRTAASALYVDSVTAGGATGTVVLVATSAGVYRSTDSGQNWTLTWSGWTTSLAASPRDPNILFAGSASFQVSTRGLLRSSDKGATWTQLPLPSGLTADQIDRVEIGTSPAAPNEVWMAVGNTSYKLQGLWRWNDGTQQWVQLTASGLYTGARRGDFGQQTFYDLVLRVDPADSNRMYLGGMRLFRSLDGGNTFTQIAGDIHVDWHALRIDPANPQRILGGNDGGVFISQDGGDSWTGRNTGLAITQFYQGLSVSPVLHSLMIAGSQDNGTSYTDGLPLWEEIMDGDGGFTAMSTNGNVLWTEAEWFNGPAIGRFDIAQGRFRIVNSGINTSDRAAFIPPLVMHPTSSNILYFGTQRLYRTIDEFSWQPISTSADLTKGSGVITRIVLARSDPDTMYIGTSDGWVRMSADRGVTFAAAGSGFPNRYVTGIAVDAANAAHVIATVSGFGLPHVWESKDAGATWAPLNGSAGSVLPDLPANAVALLAPSTIVVGTDVGVWLSSDGGATWQALANGLPNVEVNDVAYDALNQRLVAATYGRGLWTIPVNAPPAVLRGDMNQDGAVDANDALLIAMALVNRDLGNTAAGTPIQVLPYGDANCNGQLDTGDALVVLRKAVGLTTTGSCAGVVKNVTSTR